MIDPGLVVTVIVSIAGSAGVGSLISGLMSRRNVTADAELKSATAAQVLSQTSTELLAPLRAELSELRPLRGRVEKLEQGAREQKALLQAHARWDAAAVAAAAEAGVILPSPPPMYPPKVNGRGK
jgi:hypothetical protein